MSHPPRPFAARISSVLDTAPTRVGLARRVGVSPGTVTAWCNGDSVPAGDKIAGIAEYLGIPIDELVVALAEPAVMQGAE
jgi:transcriptional regulator with XRE-family HTH domain